jgi:hypothetical protein
MLVAKQVAFLLAGFAGVFASVLELAYGQAHVTVLATKIIAPKGRAPEIIEKRAADSALGEFTITYMVFDPKVYRLKLAVPVDPAQGSSGASLRRFYEDEAAVAAMSAGFLRTYSPVTPAGLVKFGGSTINKISMTDPALSAVVCFSHTNDLPSLASRSDNHLIETSDDCLQAGPLFAQGGNPHDDLPKIDLEYKDFSARKYVRTFLALNRRGEFILGQTSPASLVALQTILVSTEQESGFNVAAAIGLTGGASAGLIARGSDADHLFTLGNIGGPLPNSFVVIRR